jgi:hypothetical protein
MSDICAQISSQGPFRQLDKTGLIESAPCEKPAADKREPDSDIKLPTCPEGLHVISS